MAVGGPSSPVRMNPGPDRHFKMARSGGITSAQFFSIDLDHIMLIFDHNQSQAIMVKFG
jgi:hypothetical protein